MRSAITRCSAKAPTSLLFTENETNAERLWGVPNPTPFVKDSINDCVVHGKIERGQSGAESGRKPPRIIKFNIPPGEIGSRFDCG